MSKRFDYDGAINVYHRISKSRELDQRESDRLDELLRRKMWAEAQQRYREKRKEALNAKKRAWYAANKPRAIATSADYRQRKPHVIRAACRRYRAKKIMQSEAAE